MTNNDKYKISLIGELDETKTRKQINKDLKSLAGSIDKLKVKTEIDEKQLKELESLYSHLKSLLGKSFVDKNAINDCIRLMNRNIKGINISIDNIDTRNINKQANQIGQQIGQNISKNIEKSIDNTLSDFEKKLQTTLNDISENDISDSTFPADPDNSKKATDYFKQFFSVTSVITTGIQKVKQALSELKSVDTLLTEISKENSTLSKSQLDKIGSHSFSAAGRYGMKASDYLLNVQELYRAGYENAESIAELSGAAQNAGNMTADLANQMIIATDKAYQMNGSISELTKVLDGMNYISDHNTVNMSELSEGMSIVGSQAASLGIKADETSAVLGTMIASANQSGSEAAKAFQAILLNIQQVRDEDAGITAEGLTNYKKACEALNVSLETTKNGIASLRNPMDIIKDLANAYSKLDSNDIRRTNLLSSVGENATADSLNAILENYDMYETMLQQYAAGTGSMAKDAEKMANSWEGASNRLSNTWISVVNHFADSDAIISVINTLNDFLETIDKLTGSLNSLSALGSLGAVSGLIMNRMGIGELQFRWRIVLRPLYKDCLIMPDN